MSSSRRYFSLEEANVIVALIRPLIGEILGIRQTILEQQPQVWPVVEKAVGNGGSRQASQMVQEFQHLEGLVLQVHATGAQLKDINSGLVDFLTLRDGREVLLCWRYPEESIEYWHDLDAGFAGRQLLV